MLFAALNRRDITTMSHAAIQIHALCSQTIYWHYCQKALARLIRQFSIAFDSPPNPLLHALFLIFGGRHQHICFQVPWKVINYHLPVKEPYYQACRKFCLQCMDANRIMRSLYDTLAVSFRYVKGWRSRRWIIKANWAGKNSTSLCRFSLLYWLNVKERAILSIPTHDRITDVPTMAAVYWMLIGD